LNGSDFLHTGSGGAIDLGFDDACNAYTVTMISGQDFLRQVTPSGDFTQYGGVTNLNMGEVAVLRVPGDEFGTVGAAGEVALTYICCASCGCRGGDPQGVARLDREGAARLPMVIAATPTAGSGPFGVIHLDTGPSGLTYGRDDALYVGNVMEVGDFVRADLSSGESSVVHRLESRVYAGATFGPNSLLVAVADHTIYRVDTRSDAREAWSTTEADVTSLVRDPFTGRVLISVRGGQIFEYSSRGVLLREFAMAPASGRAAYAPDGFLYYLVAGWPTTARVLRFELPSRLE
jgi:hypothetical protein